jgi:outer membrane lipoprotein LolB
MMRLTFGLIGGAALAGCVHAPARVGTDGLDYPQRRAQLEALAEWDMRGRLAVDNGERAFQGSFEWQQQPDALRLRVRGPLGAGVLEVAGPLEHLTVTARGESREVRDPETELSALVGWWLPIESLSAWLVGLPDRRYPATTRFGSDGELTLLEQRQWQIEYLGYQLAQGLLLPRRIELTHKALDLKLVVDSWRPGALN